MKIKKLNVWLIVIMMITQWAYSFGFSDRVYAEPKSITENLITSVSLAVYTDDNYTETVTGSVYQLDSYSELNYTWALADNHGYQAGSTFEFDLPGQFELYNDLSGDLLFEGVAVGTYHVHKDSNHVIFTFNDFIEQYDQVGGIFTVRSLLSSKKIHGSTKQLLEFPIQGGTQTIELQFKPNISSMVEKKGTPLPKFYNPTQIGWTIDVNKSMESVGNAVVTDDLPSGLSLDINSITVRELEINLDGSVTAGNPISNTQYDASSSTQTKLNVQFKDSPIIKAYRVEFRTDITIAGADSTSYENTAVLSGDSGLLKSSKATATVGRGKPLHKIVNGYDAAKQTINWIIEYNYNQKPISANDAVLKDSFNNSQELITSSLKVYPVTIDDNGNGVKDDVPLSAGDYTVTPSVTGFDLKFNHDIQSAYRIEYQTKSHGRVFEDSKVTNEVVHNGNSASASQNITQQILSKSNSNVDYINKTVKWSIAVNKDSKVMNNLIVTDTFGNSGLKLIPGTLSIKPATGGTAVSTDVVYTEHNPVAANDGFIITFNAPIDVPYVITYETKFNYNWLSSGKDRFINTAALSWNEEGEATPRDKAATSTFNPRDEVKNNGLKNGSYDALTKRVTWNIGANYNMNTLTNAILLDTITGGQIVDSDSIKVYKWIYGANGNPSVSTDVDVNDYTITLSGDKLKVSFNKEINYAFYVSFKTSFANEAIDNIKVDNTAVLYDGVKKESSDLKASVNIPNGGEYINKSGAQNGNKIDWSIYINRNQSLVKDAVITDIPSDNQILLTNTFHLYKTTVSGDGTIMPTDEELIKDLDYTVKFTKDDEGRESFQLKFEKEISKAYILKYQSLITAQNNEKVSNKVNFDGKNVKEITNESNTEITVKLSSGSGTGSGLRGPLNIVKLDEGNAEKALSGAAFDLFRVVDGDNIWIAKGVTDTDGKLEFTKLIGGEYVIIEQSAPAGYQLDSTPHAVLINSITGVELKITNKTTLIPTPTPTSTPTPTVIPTDTPTVIPTPTSTATPTVIPTTTPATSETPAPTVIPSTTPATPATPETPGPTAPEIPVSTVTPAPTATPAATTTPTPVISTEPGVIVTPELPASPTPSPIPSAEPTSGPIAPLPTAVITLEDIPIEGEIPLGGIPIIGKDPAHGTVELIPDRKWKYTPDPGFIGKDKFTLIVTDEEGQDKEIEIEILVEEVPKGTLEEPSEPNDLPSRLPQTGEESMILFYLSGIGLIILGFVLSRRFNTRKE